MIALAIALFLAAANFTTAYSGQYDFSIESSDGSHGASLNRRHLDGEHDHHHDGDHDHHHDGEHDHQHDTEKLETMDLTLDKTGMSQNTSLLSKTSQVAADQDSKTSTMIGTSDDKNKTDSLVDVNTALSNSTMNIVTLNNGTQLMTSTASTKTTATSIKTTAASSPRSSSNGTSMASSGKSLGTKAWDVSSFALVGAVAVSLFL